MDILGILGGAVTVLGGIVAALGWFYKRGGDDRELTVAVRENTQANRELTSSMGGLRDIVANHETRLTVLEKRD